jgi:hypothetical protein
MLCNHLQNVRAEATIMRCRQQVKVYGPNKNLWPRFAPGEVVRVDPETGIDVKLDCEAVIVLRVSPARYCFIMRHDHDEAEYVEAVDRYFANGGVF